MNVFLSTLNQTAFLFTLIIVGYLLMKLGVLPAGASATLSKLENWVFVPALVLKTFIESFTVERISSAWVLLLVSLGIALLVIPIAIFFPRLLAKDKYTQRIYTYGLAFSNFGFMGNAVVSALFPEIFFEYLIFTLPLWTLIYVWGVPRLLIADAEKKQTLKSTLKSFVNPMFIAMVIGMIIGLSGLQLPAFLTSAISSTADCMSPVAMILTGVVVSQISLKKTFTSYKIYIVSAVRLLVLPLLFVLTGLLIKIPEPIYTCALASLSMPLGLNTIVIPSALGRDTEIAAGMAVISHLLACITIPLIFAIA